MVAEKVLSTMVDLGEPPDFVMCIGDDGSDEDMFESILRLHLVMLKSQAFFKLATKKVKNF